MCGRYGVGMWLAAGCSVVENGVTMSGVCFEVLVHIFLQRCVTCLICLHNC